MGQVTRGAVTAVIDSDGHIRLTKAEPGRWTLLQGVFTAPQGSVYAASFQLGVCYQEKGEVLTVTDAFAAVVPDGWREGDTLPAGTANLISNPHFRGGHVVPEGWKLQTAEIGARIAPAGGSQHGHGGAGISISDSNILLYTDFPVRPGQRIFFSLKVKTTNPAPKVVELWPVWRKKLALPGSNVEVPGPESPNISGYTGFNSVNMQAFYSCRSLAAQRSQILRGWGKPIIQRLADGDLIASQYKNLIDKDKRNPGYPEAFEEAALCNSRDGGRTWSEPRLPGIPGRVTQFSVLKDGGMLLATQDFAPGAPGRLYHSGDGGRTFRESRIPWEDFVFDKGPGITRFFGETNGPVQLPDGTILLLCSALRPADREYTDRASYLLRSRDGGKTWGDASFVINTDEVELLPLPDGRLLGFARLSTAYMRDVMAAGDQTGEAQVGEGGETMAVMESSDSGRVWSKPRLIGLGSAQVPAFPLLMPDGRLLLIYGNRQFPFGVQAIASRDFGRTWDLENFLMLAWASWTALGGHPRSILMPDGSIVTGYYAHYFKDNLGGNENHDVVSHCLRWTPPSDWPPSR